MSVEEQVAIGVFVVAGAASSLIYFLLRMDVKERVSVSGLSHIEIQKLHKQFYPESSLRRWFWAAFILAIVAWGVAGYMQAREARRHRSPRIVVPFVIVPSLTVPATYVAGSIIPCRGAALGGGVDVLLLCTSAAEAGLSLEAANRRAEARRHLLFKT
jgi:hypothetical protein